MNHENRFQEYIVNRIHTVIAATTDENGLPVTCAIDIMDYDSNGLCFLTAKGKGFYSRLIYNNYISFTGIKGDSTMNTVAISVGGKVTETGRERLPRLFEKNPYMAEIYPTEESRKALTVFCIYNGEGEWFDLSKKPIERKSFTIGGGKVIHKGYFITEKCTRCGKCLAVCPQNCIDKGLPKPYNIRQNNCLHCGGCLEICPVGAIERV